MTRRGGIRTRRWLFYIAVLAGWLLGAELMVVTSLGRSLPGRLPALAGWAFVVASAVFIVAVARWEIGSRSRANRLVSQLDDALGSITALTEASLSSLSLDELLDQLLGRLQAVLGADVAAILLQSADGRELVPRAVHGAASAASTSTLSSDVGLVGQAVATQALCESDDAEDLAELATFGPGLTSAAACPIVVQGCLIGICLAGSFDPVRFDERELHLLRLVADRAGLGIERARLDDAEHRSRLVVERAQRNATMLVAASDALATAQDEYEANLAALVDAAVPAFGDWCSIDLLDDAGTLRCIAIRHDGGVATAGGQNVLQTAPCSAELRAGVAPLHKMLALANAGAGVQLWSRGSANGDETNAPGPVSCIVVAIEVGDVGFGAITFAVDRGRDGYTPADTAVAADVARRASVAIERAQLYREARQSARRSQRMAGQLHLLIEASLHVARFRHEPEVIAAVANRARRLFDAQLAVVDLTSGAVAPLRAVDDRTQGAARGRPPAPQVAVEIPVTPDDPSLPWQADGWLVAHIPGPGGPRGTVAAYRGGEDTFGADDERVLVLLAQTAATAIDAAELYRTVQGSENRWRVLVETAPVGIVEVDLIGHVRWWNHAAATVFGWTDEEATGGSVTAVPDFSPRAAEKLRELWSEVASGAAVVSREMLAVPAGGERRDLAVSAAPLLAANGTVENILTLVADVTDRRRLAAERLQAQRMEAIGQLAGSVAHEFNNLLTLIGGYTELLRRHLQADERAAALLGDLHSATARAGVLTAQLLNLSRHAPLRPVILSPVGAVHSLAEVLERVVPAEVEIACSLDASAGRVRIDEGQFEQLLVNLVMNARDAISGPGQIHITVEGVGLEAKDAVGLALRPGRHVRIAVTDTGAGMDEETRERCFEPLYTTKGSSTGTGLGLPSVRQTVLACGGAIRFDTDLGSGTTFEVLLPAVDERARVRDGDPSIGEPDVALAPSAPHSQATVLLAEDDDSLRRLVRRVLAHNGYTVLEAASGSEALEIARAQQGRIDVLVSDVVMPGLNGPDVAQRLRELHPDLAVLLVSGSTDAGILSGLSDESTEFLAKPFRPSDVIERVRGLLAGITSRATYEARGR